MDDPRIGTQLGNYRIEALIGRGGMGVVYLAQHLRMATRKAAIKVLAPELAEDPEFRERFIRESDLASSLDHPNIIPVYDADEADGVLFSAMRYVNGTDLKGVIESEGRLTQERTLAILGDVAAALDFAHEHGLVHRDVKPGNVMIEAPQGERGHERVFLTDFGLVKRMRSETKLTKTGYFVGTLDYAAPEVFRGDDLDGRADVYALGCVLYECLADSAPFSGSVEAVMFGHVMSEPPHLSSARSDLPPALDDVIRIALSKAKEDRYATAGALVEAARRAVAAGSPAAHTEIPARGETKIAPPPPVLGESRAPPHETTSGPAPQEYIAPPAPEPQVREPSAPGSPIEARLEKPTLAGEPAGEEPPPTKEVVPPAPPFDHLHTGHRPPAPSPKQAKRAPGPLVQPGPEHVRPPESRRRRKVLLASVAVVAALGTILGVLLVGGSSPGPVRPSVTTSAIVLTRAATIKVGKRPDAATFGDGAVWIANNEDGTVSRIDPATNQVTATITVGKLPDAATFGSGAVWIVVPVKGGSSPDSINGAVLRIDPTTNQVTATITVGQLPGAATFGDGALWIVNFGSVSRINPATDRVTATIKAPTGLRNYATFGAGAVWILGQDGLVRIDAATKRATGPIKVGRLPQAAAFGHGALWIGTGIGHKVVARIDPATNAVAATIQMDAVPVAATFGGGLVWVTRNDNTVSVIDPATNRVSDTIPVGSNPSAVAFDGGDGAAWIANSGDGTVTRIQT